MPVRLFLIDKVIRFQMKRRFAANPDIMLLRPMMRAMARRPARRPSRVEIVATSLGGVPTERVSTPASDPTRAILYLHGGAFVAGSPANHRALTWRLADGVGAPVYAIDYRLAPEHPFPAGLDDALAAYRALLAQGVAPEHVAVGGDSAGGNLTLALTHKLLALGLPVPAALVCLSPSTELLDALGSHVENRSSDAMFVQELLGSVRSLYCTVAEAETPFASPLRGDHTGFPPTILQCSAREMLRDDSVLLADRLRAANVEVELEVWPRVYHVWQLAADILPEARDAVARLVTFLNRHLS